MAYSWEDVKYQQASRQLQAQEEQTPLLGDEEMKTMDSFIQERTVGIERIEKDVVTVNSITKDISVLVEHQGDMMDVIENNVETTHETAEDGLREIRNSKKWQDKATKKHCFLLLVILFVFIVLVIVAVGVGKKHKG